MFRKLARELVIFIFIAGFVGAGLGMFHEFEVTKPTVMITLDPPVVKSVLVPESGCMLRPPNEKVSSLEIVSCPPWEYYQALQNGTIPTPCEDSTDEWAVLKPDGCQETSSQITQRQTWARARFEAGENAKREVRPSNVAIFGAFGFGLGASAGIVLWLLYRAARFAITG